MPPSVSFIPAMLVPARSFPRSWPPSVVNLLVALGFAGWAWSFCMVLLTEPRFLEGTRVPLAGWLAGLQGLEQSGFLRTYVAWSSEGMLAGKIWQPLTHLFVHQGLVHATINLGLLWLAGRSIESILGWRLLLALYLACGITGGMLELTLAPLHASVLGSSAGVLGVMAAACVVWNDYDLRSWRLLSWLPVPLRLRLLLLGIVLVQFSAFLIQNNPTQADRLLRAHSISCLAGLALGYLVARRLGFGRRSVSRRPPPALPPAIEMETELAEDPHEYIRDEIDPILDKIRARGMDSLTAGERRRLARASRMLSR